MNPEVNILAPHHKTQWTEGNHQLSIFWPPHCLSLFFGLLFPLMLSLTCYSWFPVPGAPPRKLEVEAINSTAIRVTWKPPLQGKQHGQIRGYQVIFSRLENGEPRGQPNIMDVALPEAQVLDDVLLVSVCSSLMFISHYCHPTLHLYSLPFSEFTLHFPPYEVTHGIFFLSTAAPPPSFLYCSLHTTFDSKLVPCSHSFGFWIKRSILILQ